MKKLFLIFLLVLIPTVIHGSTRVIPWPNLPIGSPLLLDKVDSANLYSAYSVSRKLRNGYSGAAFQVRRASDNTTTNIGFIGTAVDTAGLLAFCSGTDGFLPIVYNQGPASSRDIASASGNQPKIVTAGVLETGNNSRPCMVFDGSDDFLNLTATIALPVSFYIVVANTSTVNIDTIIYGGSTTRASLKQRTGPLFGLNSGTDQTYSSYVNGNWYLVRATFQSGNEAFRLNANSEDATKDAGSNSVTSLGFGAATATGQFKSSELIYFNQGTHADEATILADINAHYALY